MATPEDRDLSARGRPIGGLFEQPRSPAEWLRYALGAEEIRCFREHGYLTGIRILNERQVEVLRDELARIVSPSYRRRDLFYEYHRNEAEDPDRVLFHALGAWRAEPGFHDLLWAPALRMAAYQLLGGTVRQFHDQLFSKPAGRGGVVAWHQDYSYWTWTKPMAHLTCWVALDDVSTENGCLCYISGSHRWSELPITGLAGDMDAVRDVLTDEQREAFDRRVPVELESGTASFHHPLMMHGSYENISTRERRAAVVNVIRDGVRSNRKVFRSETDYGNFPILPQDEPLAGRFYPVLFDPEKELGEGRLSVPTLQDVERS